MSLLNKQHYMRLQFCMDALCLLSAGGQTYLDVLVQN